MQQGESAPCDFKICKSIPELHSSFHKFFSLWVHWCTVNMEALSSWHCVRVTYVSQLITSCAHVHVCAWLCDCINKNGIKKEKKNLSVYLALRALCVS